MSAWTNIKDSAEYIRYQGHEIAQRAEHASAAEQGAEHGETLGDVLLHHVSNSNELEIFSYKIHLPELPTIFGIDMSITKYVLMMWIAAFLVFMVFKFGMKWNNLVPKGKLTGFFEPIVVFVKDEIVLENFGKKNGRKFVPFFLTVFFFILFMNLLGLIPFMGTATSDVSVTGTLAAVTFLLIHLGGIIHHGFFKHWGNFIPQGVPWWIWPILFPVEVIGTIGRCFALMIRLFASMTAGHIVIFAFLGLMIVMHSYAISLFAIPVVLVILGLEIFFAFLQAYIFTFLSALFISMTYHGSH